MLDTGVTFLNHGSFGAVPKPVFEEYQQWQKDLERQPVEFLGRRITALMGESRKALGMYLGAHADNLIYTQNVTISLNMVAHSLELGPGDEVLSTDHEYGAMDRMWRFLSKERGFQYIQKKINLPITSRNVFVDQFWEGVTPNTRVIFISHITSPTAIIFPVEEIITRAKAAGILTIVDGAHVAGQLDLRLDQLGADFYGGNLHKWLCAPKGAGYLYASPNAQKLIKPLVVSWGYEAINPSNSPFVDHNEWWGTRDMAAFLTVPAAIRFQEEHGWATVRTICHELLLDTQKRICQLTGIAPLHSQEDIWFRQMAAAPLPGFIDEYKFQKQLYEEYKIEVPILDWGGKKLIRVSVQGYNSQEDLEKMYEALGKCLGNPVG